MIELDRGEVAVLKLDNPPVNALCKDMLEELSEALSDIKDDVKENKTRAVIVRGKGDNFVGGADISEMKDMSPEEAEQFSILGHKVFMNIKKLPVPVIAAVDGYALGGGMELAMSCDIIFASEDSQFGQPEVGLGVIPGFGGTQFLPRLIGESKAKELLYTGKRIGSQEAEDIGLVNEIHLGEELFDKAVELAEEMAGNAPIAVSKVKRAVDEGMDLPLHEALEREAEHFKGCFDTKDQKEGMEAFQDKRKPDFEGE